MAECKKHPGTAKVIRSNARGGEYVVCPICKPEGGVKDGSPGPPAPGIKPKPTPTPSPSAKKRVNAFGFLR